MPKLFKKYHVYPHIYRFAYLKPVTVLWKGGATVQSLKWLAVGKTGALNTGCRLNILEKSHKTQFIVFNVLVASIYILWTQVFKMTNFSFSDSSVCELQFIDQVANFWKVWPPWETSPYKARHSSIHLSHTNNITVCLHPPCIVLEA
jgi:hypothetical protein